MKSFLLLIVLSLPAASVWSQESSEQVIAGQRVWRVPRLPVENGDIVYREKVSMPGASRDELFNRAHSWLKNNLRGAASDIHIDRARGQVIGRGMISYKQGVVADARQAIYFDYDVRTEDAGYRYVISNIQGNIGGSRIVYAAMYAEELNKGDGNGQWTHKYRYELLSDLHSFITLFLQGLKSSMAE